MSAETEAKRELRKFWVNEEGVVSQEVGYSCAPANPTYWFFPSLGFSAGEGHSIFPTKAEAIADAKKELTGLIADAQAKLAKLAKETPHPCPICPHCKTAMRPTAYIGYYDSFNCWLCDCDEIPNAEESRGEYA